MGNKNPGDAHVGPCSNKRLYAGCTHRQPRPPRLRLRHDVSTTRLLYSRCNPSTHHPSPTKDVLRMCGVVHDAAQVVKVSERGTALLLLLRHGARCWCCGFVVLCGMRYCTVLYRLSGSTRCSAAVCVGRCRVACGRCRVACGVRQVACGVWHVACGVCRVTCGR